MHRSEQTGQPRGDGGIPLPANGSGMRTGSCSARGPSCVLATGVLCQGEPRGGHACGVGDPGPRTPPLWQQAPGSGSTLQLEQGDRQSLGPACPQLVSRHPNHQRLRGALRKGVHP